MMSLIVFPMAGVSKRFTDAGFSVPKYMLDVNGKTVFRRAVESFIKYFNDYEFIFIFRNVLDTDKFIINECKEMGLEKYLLVDIEKNTSGQAETVYLGLEHAQVPIDTPITIFNIDTFRPNFAFPKGEEYKIADGYLEVFKGSGSNWSFVAPKVDDRSLVAETAEKRPISNLCSTGLYHFRTAKLFKDVFLEAQMTKGSWDGELYVAPLYNKVIHRGGIVRYYIIERKEVVFCGVPSEYRDLLI